MQDSAPPASMTSASPDCIKREASPREWAPVVQAVVTAWFGPYAWSGFGRWDDETRRKGKTTHFQSISHRDVAGSQVYEETGDKERMDFVVVLLIYLSAVVDELIVLKSSLPLDDMQQMCHRAPGDFRCLIRDKHPEWPVAKSIRPCPRK